MALYLDIRDLVRTAWTDGWTHPTVPVFWRSQDVATLPDPRETHHWLRNELRFDQETTVAFGGGPGNNEKLKFGTLIVRVFADIEMRDDTMALRLLSDAEAIFRGQRIGSMSFYGFSGIDGTDAGLPPRDIGNWTTGGTALNWEYRFTG